MRLGVSMLPIHTPGGIGRYARILGSILLTKYSDKVHLFLSAKDDVKKILSELPAPARESFTLPGNVHLHFSRMPNAPRHLMHVFELGRVMAAQKLDAYLDPDYIIPDIAGVPCSCVIHDTSPFTAPNTLGPKARIIYGTGAKRALRNAYRLFCDSAATHKSLTELFPEYSNKLRLVEACLAPKFNAASSEAYRPQNSVRIQTSFGEIDIPQPFVLHVGVPGPRKNINVLLAAFAEVKLRMFPHRLVLVGGQTKPLPKPKQTLPQVALPDGSTYHAEAPLPDVLALGRISDDDLVTLYRHADLLVLPSLEEGFGYPVLEALAFRTPALVSAGSPLAGLPGVAVMSNIQNPAHVAADIEETLRSLSDLASQMAAGFNINRFCCDRYLDDLLRALSS